jgi:hypothetical protein
MKLEFLLDIIFKKCMKICTGGAELFHADRHDEASSRFSQFSEGA